MDNSKKEFFELLYDNLTAKGYSFYTNGENYYVTLPGVNSLVECRGFVNDYILDSYHKADKYNDLPLIWSVSDINILTKDGKSHYIDYNLFWIDFFINHPEERINALNEYLAFSDQQDCFNQIKQTNNKQAIFDFGSNFFITSLNQHSYENGCLKIISDFFKNSLFTKDEAAQVAKNFYLKNKIAINNINSFVYFKDFILDIFKDSPEELQFYKDKSPLFKLTLEPKPVRFYSEKDNKINLHFYLMELNYNTQFLNVNTFEFLFTQLTNSIEKHFNINDKLIVNRYEGIHTDKEGNITSKKPVYYLDFNSKEISTELFMDIVKSYFSMIKDSKFTQDEIHDDYLINIQPSYISSYLLDKQLNPIINNLRNKNKQKI